MVGESVSFWFFCGFGTGSQSQSPGWPLFRPPDWLTTSCCFRALNKVYRFNKFNIGQRKRASATFLVCRPRLWVPLPQRPLSTLFRWPNKLGLCPGHPSDRLYIRWPWRLTTGVLAPRPFFQSSFGPRKTTGCPHCLRWLLRRTLFFFGPLRWVFRAN